MGLKEILDKLGVQNLDESVQAEVKETLSEMIELKAKEKASEMVEEALIEEKQSLVNEMEARYEEFTNDMLGKWSDFLDSTIDEEVQLPESIVEYARIGETYKPIIDMIRARLGVEAGSIDEEAKAIMGEAKEEIISLRDKLNSALVENADMKTDAKAMATQLYIRKKCDGLTEAQKSRVLTLIGDLTDRSQIDEKFEFIKDNFLNEDDEEFEYGEDEKKEKKDKKKKKKGHKEPDEDDKGGPSDDDEDDKEECKDKDKKKNKMMEQYYQNWQLIDKKF